MFDCRDSVIVFLVGSLIRHWKFVRGFDSAMYVEIIIEHFDFTNG